ncbi:nitrate- and nitrite sensing domain-containing protein [Streptomyces sp. M2CJ-2]|uniref:sensor histidine kinase n=1 Tax=Streptomyces sp. M2CJ-2 TaxID=2803948 RepID=UPI001925D502|nr:nitrate- and nitrite sensing domain-containing protein [Streptomyces sp. M2CJ-2]MBL3668551.1 nitrate- and nitrite sensing domain-containing protein [Streptomyces sp. M2CJ-2]
MSPRTGARRRLGSIRLSLVLLALVPSVTLAAMWGVTTIQMFSEGLQLRAQTELSRSTGAMGTEATLALQRERSLSAAWLATPGTSRTSRTALEVQRRMTDAAVAKVVGQADAIAEAPARVSDQLYSVLGSVGSLEYYRDQMDNPTEITAEQALDQYTWIIDDQIHAFQELSQVDDGDLTSQAGPLVALEHAAELVSQADTRLTLAWPSGQIDEEAWFDFAELVHTRRWLIKDQILPSLRGSTKAQAERIQRSAEWRTLEEIEDQVLATHPTGENGRIDLPDAQQRWNVAMDKIAAEYSAMVREQTDALLTRTSDEARSLLLTAASLSVGGLLALLVCVGVSWRITRSLSRRLHGLRMATLSLAEERLPDVVARLERGEKVDAESATTPLDYGHDELGQVAQAFNTAQRTAVHTAVELADTRRGFQKIILGIARQSQNLVNLQLSKLDALERRHTDPEVLKGLYELDSTASQLRRYEENLVIVSGERPGRSWSEPVALIDILRSAVGEVAEYQRVEVHTDEEVALAPPAVADVIHLLAELIDNATVYSPAPSPVGVRAAMVAKGLAVEVEDRGLGMSEDDYASMNAQLAKPPQFDVVALADDLRLGMFVISQLAHRHGIAVTLRPSPYGGTTAIVLLPHTIVVCDAPHGAEAAPTVGVNGHRTAAGPDRAATTGTTDTADAEDTKDTKDAEDAAEPENAAGARPPATDAADATGTTDAAAGTAPSRPGAAVRTAPRPATTAPGHSGLTPLPRRVPQTSLAAELREEVAASVTEHDSGDFTAEDAASSLGGFQRGTSRARADSDDARADDDAAPPSATTGTTASSGAPAGPRELPNPPSDR